MKEHFGERVESGQGPSYSGTIMNDLVFEKVEKARSGMGLESLPGPDYKDHGRILQGKCHR